MIIREKITVNGIQIAVKRIGPGKNTILFIHGNSMSSDTWLPQFEDKNLNSKYQLIAFDLPGNGESDWYHKNETANYRPKKLALLVKSILDHYKVDRFLLVGLSYGTNIIGEITTPFKHCAGILLEGTCIVNDKFNVGEVLAPVPNGHVMAVPTATDEELNGFVVSVAENKEIRQRFIESYRKADPIFREELGKTLLGSELSDELENIRKWNLDVCVMFGKEEKLVKTDYLNQYETLWNGKVYFIENAGHLINEETPEKFNEILLAYADERFR